MGIQQNAKEVLMLNTPFSPWPSFTEEDMSAVSDVLRSNKVNYWTGTIGKSFENAFASFSDTQFAIALNNGTTALEIALKALAIQEGDEVIVTPRSFFASASCIINVGAVPIFADVDLNSQNLTAKSIKEKISPQTKAIICVHLAGFPCDMLDIVELAKTYQLSVIEDCAQAHGAKINGQSVGSFGDIGAWSFCQDKIMTTGGEGGMITTNRADLYEKCWSLKEHGKSKQLLNSPHDGISFRYICDSFGTNGRMTEMQAAIGLNQLKHMTNWHRIRLDNQQRIWETAKRLPLFRVPKIPSHMIHAAYKCYLFIKVTEQDCTLLRNEIITYINDSGVPCYTGSCPEIYLENAFRDHPSRPKTYLPNARKLGKTSIMLLVHPTLTQENIDKTCEVLEKTNEVFIPKIL
jgi:dTDP-4-amino-4,6-dideoxygalactose transaminase